MRLQNKAFETQKARVVPITGSSESSKQAELPPLVRLVVAELPDRNVAPSEIVAHIRANYPDAQIMFVAPQATAAIGGQPGAATLAATGEAPKSSLHAITRTAGPAPDGKAVNAVKRLPRRQAEAAMCLVRGLSNKEIAREMGLSESTVKVYLVSIFRILGVHSRASAVSTILGSPDLRRELEL